MLFIGVTGGIGAGKTSILTYMEENYLCRVMLADEIAHDLMEPQSGCYDQLKNLLSADDVWMTDGRFDRPKLASVLFSDEKRRDAVDAIVHPAVKEYVRQQKVLEQKQGRLDLLVIEAALLIEEHYDEVCDELWYIYTSKENRRERLKKNRGYSDAKVDSIFASQISEETFRAHCAETLDNNGTPEEAFSQVDVLMKKKGIRRR